MDYRDTVYVAILQKVGCTDPNATNYDPEANLDDGSCTYSNGSCSFAFSITNFRVEWLYHAPQNHYHLIAKADSVTSATMADGSQSYEHIDWRVHEDGVVIWPSIAVPSWLTAQIVADMQTSVGWNVFGNPPTVFESCNHPSFTSGLGVMLESKITSISQADSNCYGADAVVATHQLALDCSGCTDSTANNYDSNAVVDDGSCIYDVWGCTDPNANNYDSSANVDDDSCTYTIYGCTDSNADNYDPNATDDDGSCEYWGCTDSNASNYDPNATHDDGSCTDPPSGGDHYATFDVTSCIDGSTISVYDEWEDYAYGYMAVYDIISISDDGGTTRLCAEVVGNFRNETTQPDHVVYDYGYTDCNDCNYNNGGQCNIEDIAWINTFDNRQFAITDIAGTQGEWKWRAYADSSHDYYFKVDDTEYPNEYVVGIMTGGSIVEQGNLSMVVFDDGYNDCDEAVMYWDITGEYHTWLKLSVHGTKVWQVFTCNSDTVMQVADPDDLASTGDYVMVGRPNANESWCGFILGTSSLWIVDDTQWGYAEIDSAGYDDCDCT